MLKSPPRNLIWWTVTIHLYTLDVLNFQASILNCWPSTFNSYPRTGPSWQVLCANINILTLECGQKLDIRFVNVWSVKQMLKNMMLGFHFKNTLLLFGVNIMWVACSFFRVTLQKTDENCSKILSGEFWSAKYAIWVRALTTNHSKAQITGSYHFNHIVAQMWVLQYDTTLLRVWFALLLVENIREDFPKNTFPSEHWANWPTFSLLFLPRSILPGGAPRNQLFWQLFTF